MTFFSCEQLYNRTEDLFLFLPCKTSALFQQVHVPGDQLNFTQTQIHCEYLSFNTPTYRENN